MKTKPSAGREPVASTSVLSPAPSGAATDVRMAAVAPSRRQKGVVRLVVGALATFFVLVLELAPRPLRAAARVVQNGSYGPRRVAGPFLALALIALPAAPASAATTRNLLATFGSSGSGAGQLQSPQNLAIDQSTGDVYVADEGNNRIDKFDSSGSFILAFGKGVDQTTGGDVCSAASGDSCQAGSAGAAAGEFTTAMFVAVDNSAGASAGDVYVGDTGDSLVSKFDSSGHLVSSWASGGQLDGATATDGPFGSVDGIAVDTGGDLLVINDNNETFGFAEDGTFTSDFATVRGMARNGLGVDSSGDLFKVNGDGSVEELTSGGASDVGQVSGQSGSASALAVDPATGDLYLGGASSTIEEYIFTALGQVRQPDGSTCTFGLSSSCPATESFSLPFNPSGIDVASASGNVYVADPAGGQISIYGPAVTVPDVVPADPSSVQPGSATLNGNVNPDGLAVTECHFDYGPDSSYGQSVPCAQSPASIGSGSADVAVSADISGLDPDTTYHFRLVASNANGTNQSPDGTFSTTGPLTVCSQAAQNVAQTTATLDAQLNPHGFDTTYHFEYGTDTSYGTSVPATDADAGAGTDCIDASTDISGLQSGATYHFRVVATSSQGTVGGADETFTTDPPAQIGAVTATDLTATAATLNATINPLGNDTTCRFDYGTDTSYGTSVSCSPADLGSGSSDVSAAQQITGLSANTEYHYRVVAQNTLGTVRSVDHTFSYDTSGGGLPDGRAYEMVSPPQKNGALLGAVLFGTPPVASSDGSRIATSAVQCFADASSCNTDQGLVGSPYAFTRTSSGWQASAGSPPAAGFSHIFEQGMIAETGMSLFRASTSPAGVFDWYSRSPGGAINDIGPLAPGSTRADEEIQRVLTSPDLGHIVWGTTGPRWPFDPSTGQALYEYAGSGNSQPLLVGVDGGPGSTDVISPCRTQLGPANGAHSAPGALSDNGAVVYFTSFGTDDQNCQGPSSIPTDTLYARVDNEGPSAHTVLISGRSGADCSTPACQNSAPRDAEFETASQNGTRAYFTSTQQLTDEATEDTQPGDGAVSSSSSLGCHDNTGANGCNLYLYDASRPAGHELTDASAGDTSGVGPQVRGVMAVSADGSHVYFVAGGVLADNVDAEGRPAQAGQNNLYVYDAATAVRSFVTALPDSDKESWEQGASQPTNVTPDGRFLVFVSRGNLTPDDTSRSGANQVFRYDANTGQLIRVSVGENGFNDNGNRPAPSSCVPAVCGEDAAIAPGNSGGARLDPTMSDDGSYVFFTSPVALTSGALDDVPIDTNQFGTPVYANNLYEWHDGHVALISDGRDTSVDSSPPFPCIEGGNASSSSSVCLIGTDTTGRDVFFATADPLLAQDTDTELDYYDARIGGGFTGAAPPAPCQDDSCQGAFSVRPAPPDAATVTFSGPRDAQPTSSVSAAPGKVKVATKAVRGASFLVAVKAPGEGLLTVSGVGVRSVSRAVRKAGTSQLRVRLTKKEARALKRKGKLRLSLHVRFSAASGPASQITFSITDKA